MASSDVVLTTNADGQDLVAIGATMQWDPQAIMLHAEDPGEIAKRNPEMNVERMRFSWKALKDGAFVYGSDPSGALTGKFDPQRWNENYQILRSLEVIAKDIDPTRCYTLEFTKGL